MTRQLSTILASALLVLASSTAMAGWNDCQHSEEREGSAAVAANATIVVHARAGFLKINGVDGADRLNATGTACADDAEVLSQIALTIDGSGNRVVVRTEFPEEYRGNARLDLTLEVPASSQLQVHDGSGGTWIENVAALDLEDGSGEIQVRKVGGPVSISDGSGEIELSEVQGKIDITDGSGEIEVRNVTGPVRLEDGSGDVLIDTVATDVLVDDDGSGDLTIRNVTGSVRIDDDGSGDIRISSVGGDVVVDDAGSGDVDVRDVTGTVQVPPQ